MLGNQIIKLCVDWCSKNNLYNLIHKDLSNKQWRSWDLDQEGDNLIIVSTTYNSSTILCKHKSTSEKKIIITSTKGNQMCEGLMKNRQYHS
jgi:phosphoheptose isomerase